MKANVAVLFGGTSAEREISLKSGHAVARGLKAAGYAASECDVASDDLSSLEGRSFDCTFVALHGGFGEGGGIQHLLDDVQLPYTGSGPEASRLAMDKWATKEIFLRTGIPTPHGRRFRLCDWEAALPAFVDDVGLPVVVKPRSQGSSLGVSIVRKRDDLPAAAQRAFASDREIVVERFIIGRELTVAILGSEPLPVVEIVPSTEFFDFDAKYTKGLTNYYPNPDLPGNSALTIQTLALAAHDALGCRHLSRVDLIAGVDGPVILEVNTIPGFTETSLVPMAAHAMGIDFPDLCADIVELTLKRVPA